MASVNDLAKEWSYEGCVHCGSPANEGDVLNLTAEDAWHPVSEPPTEADSDDVGHVAVWWGEEKRFGTMNYSVVPVSGPNLQWARIRDVVLLPEELH